VDTGMGFERLCMVLQGKRSNYDTDVFQPLIQAIAKKAGIPFGAVTPALSRSREDVDSAMPGQARHDNAGEKADIAMRVIADHLRAISFAIADGQLPSNTVAGYVIRRILRRAVRYGYSFLGFNQPFMHTLVPTLAGQMGDQFPELRKQQQLVESVIEEEEKAFLRTLEQGTKRLEQALAESKGTLAGDRAFELFDTYGFPIDLTQLMAREQGMSVDMKGFEAELQKQKERSRAATAVTTGDWVELGKGETAFIGYDELSTEARILRYRKVSGKGGDQFQLVLHRTPFYAEGGGQVGDQGWLIQGADQVEVIDTKRENQLIVHFTKELPKDVEKPLTAQVNTQRRGLTARNHTATHLLHHALRKHLGTHVEQKGSLVAPDRLRFDISHFAKVTPEELATIEREVNAMITDDIEFEDKRNMPIAEAKAMGAMALFGEKYGDWVRVVEVEGVSRELCGGTHVRNTAEIGVFKIESEGSSASNVRRIEALTGPAAVSWLRERSDQLDEVGRILGGSWDAPAAAAERLRSRLDDLESVAQGAGREELQRVAGELADSAQQVGEVSVIVGRADGGQKDLLELADRLRRESGDGAVVLGGADGDKAALVASFGPGAVSKGLSAATVVRDAAELIGGGGGGRDDAAQAGGKQVAKVDDALAQAREAIATALEGGD